MQTKSIPAGVRASFPFSVSLPADYAIDHHAPTSYRSVARGIFIFKELLYMVLVVFVVSKWRIYNRNFGRERTGFIGAEMSPLFPVLLTGDSRTMQLCARIIYRIHRNRQYRNN